MRALSRRRRSGYLKEKNEKASLIFFLLFARGAVGRVLLDDGGDRRFVPSWLGSNQIKTN